MIKKLIISSGAQPFFADRRVNAIKLRKTSSRPLGKGLGVRELKLLNLMTLRGEPTGSFSHSLLLAKNGLRFLR